MNPPSSQTTDAPVGPGAGEVRTFRGKTIEELIPQIRAQLGPGAIILREREGLSGGIGGFFAQRCVEIDAQAPQRVSVYADDEDALEDDEMEAPAIPMSVLASPEAQAFTASAAAEPWAEIAADAPAPQAPPVVAPAPAPAPVAAPMPPVPPVPPVLDEATFAARLEQAAQTQPEAPQFIAFEEMAAPEPEPEPEPEPVAIAEPVALAEPEPIPVPVAIDTPPSPQPAAFRAAAAAVPAAPMPAVVAPAHPAAAVVKRRRGGLAERMVRAAQAAQAAAQTYAASAVEPAVPAPAPAPVPIAAPVPAPAVPASQPDPESVAAEPTLAPAPPAAPAHPAPTEELQRRLLDAGLSRTRAHELIGAALEITEDDDDLPDAVREELVAALPAPPRLPLQGGAIAVVGGGGSGKTHSVAALAVACARASSLPVTVARLGTPERATELAELVRGENVDVIPAMRTRATVRAVSSARERGLVILDTPAASPADRSAVDVLGEALTQFELDGLYLTVPATFTARAAAKLTEGFAPLGLDGLLATHTDEADQLGVVAELSIQTGLPISHTHAGADVTTAITAITPEEISEALLP